jgi:hypothetical protein
LENNLKIVNFVQTFNKIMKKILFTIALFSGLTVNAQLAPGSFAQNFTITAFQPGLQNAGMNGNGTYKLYDYLNAGYTVIFDVSATWCGPCWNYHNTGALDQLYAAHGPAGQPGVNANTTNDVMVIWIDGDPSTADATMLNGAGAIGNWINPTGNHEVTFPMANPTSAVTNQITSAYAIGYYPTIYRICPDRIVTEIGQANAATLYQGVGQCPSLPTASIDAKIINSTGASSICGPGNYTPKVKIQNYGLSPLTSATVNVISNGNVVSTGTYSGNLETFSVADVTCSVIENFEGGELTIVVNPAGDVNPANGTLNLNVLGASQAEGVEVFVEIVTDKYGSETTWNIKNSTGTTVLSGGPYNDLSAAGPGTTVQPIKSVTLNENECYTFTILDSYNDGIFSTLYGEGSYTVKDAQGNVLATGGEFTTSESKPFKSGSVSSGVGLTEKGIANFTIFPNPSNGIFTVKSDEMLMYNSLELVDQVGRILKTYEISNTTLNIELDEIANGNYNLIFKNSNGKHIEKIQISK